MRVDAVPAADAFTHCYFVEVDDIKEVNDELEHECGLGMRQFRARTTNTSGYVFVLVRQDGKSPRDEISRISKEIATPSGKRRLLKEAAARIASLNAKRQKVSSKHSTQSAMADQTTNEAADVRGQQSTKKKKRAATTKNADEEDLHARQVRVLQNRMETILPSLPTSILSIELVQRKLEEIMRKPHGRFDKFQEDIENVVRAHIEQRKETMPAATEGESMDAAPGKKRAQTAETEDTTPAATRPTDDGAVGVPTSEGDGEADDVVEEKKPLPSLLDQGAKDRKAEPDFVEVDEEFDSQTEYEVDEWGFQIAMRELQQSTSPEQAMSILEKLWLSVPTPALLEGGEWEGALTSLLEADIGTRGRVLLRNIRTAWRRQQHCARGGTALDTAYAALATLQMANLVTRGVTPVAGGVTPVAGRPVVLPPADVVVIDD